MADKSEIREKLKIKRRYFQYSAREVADGAIADIFLQVYGGFKSFFVYNSVGSEAGTSLIIKELLTLGKQVYLPKIVDGEMFPALYGECEKGAFGILEPVNGIYTGGIDVTVVPLLAVNAKGYRIGYGKGFYDRFLKDRHTVKAGLGYYFQIEDFSEDEWDVPLDAFVCERGIKYYGK